MDFKETTGKPIIKVLEPCIPQIIISPLALDKMKVYVDECDEEVGWLGTAERQGRDIYITDMYLFEQEVSSVTTDIDEASLTAFAQELLQREDGVEIWNNIRVWGHSHVKMATNPSGTDEDQMETFVECGHEWFIRIIANKLSSLRVDLFDYKQGVIYNDLPWTTGLSKEEAYIYEQIVKLESQLDLISEKRMEAIQPTIKAEIKEKVKKKAWGNYKNYQTQSTYHTTNYTTHTTPMTDKSNVYTLPTTDDDDWIKDEEDISAYLDESTLLEIGECTIFSEVADILEMYGYDKYFSLRDVNKIWSYAVDLVKAKYFEGSNV